MPPKSSSKRKVKSKAVVESDLEDRKPTESPRKSPRKSLPAKKVVESDAEADDDEDVPNLDEPTASDNDFIVLDNDSEEEIRQVTPLRQKASVTRPSKSKLPLSEDDNLFEPSPILDTPTKKRSGSALKTSKQVLTPTKKTPMRNSMLKRKREPEPDSAEDSDEEAADFLNESDNTMSESARKISKNQKIFNDAIASASKEKGKLKAPKLEPLSENTVYLEDIAPQHLKSPSYPRPSKSGVLRKNLMDPLLKHTYSRLGNLPGGYYNLGWKEVSDTDVQTPMLSISKALKAYPDVDADYIVSLITFEMDVKTNVVNLSRVAFERLKVAKLYATSSTKMVYLSGQQSPALCVCVASVWDDRTREVETRGGFESKSLHAIMVTQEYELKVTNLCLLYKVPFIRSQLNDNCWSFSTRPSSDGYTNQKSLSYTSAAGSSTPKKSRLMADVPSPVNARVNASGSTAIHNTLRYSLTAKDDIPIFDARHKHIALPSGIRNVPKNFNIFEEPVPIDSIVLIAYSVAGYAAQRTPEDTSISLNIAWAAVLASPEDPPCTSSGPRMVFYDDPVIKMLASSIPLENESYGRWKV